MMVPSTSDGLEAPIRGAMMTASSFSCRMGNLAFHPAVTAGTMCLSSCLSRLRLALTDLGSDHVAGHRPVSCRRSDCLRSEGFVAVDPLITAEC